MSCRPSKKINDGGLSPCTLDCVIVVGLCRGCLRNQEEIARWSKMSDEEKRQVLEKLKLRRAGA